LDSTTASGKTAEASINGYCDGVRRVSAAFHVGRTCGVPAHFRLIAPPGLQ
jgi:hypothetical protein